MTRSISRSLKGNRTRDYGGLSAIDLCYQTACNRPNVPSDIVIAAIDELLEMHQENVRRVDAFVAQLEAASDE